MKLLASRFARTLSLILRTIFFWLSKVLWGQPILTWMIAFTTAGLFILEFAVPDYGASVFESWAALAVWVVTVLLATVFARASTRTAARDGLENQPEAARASVSVSLVWLALIALFWWANGAQLASEFARAFLAGLLLLPSFALNLIFLQRGLRDSSFNVDVILLNKTGTLTQGNRSLSFVQVAQNSPLKTQAQILALAAGLESDNADDLFQAIRERVKRRGLTPVDLKDVMSIPGLAMSGRLDGSRVVLGGPDQLVAHNTNIDVVDLVRADQANSEGQTVLYLLLDGVLCGYLGFADEARTDLKFYVQLLQYRRKRVVVYSQDAHETTRFFANELGCTEFYGEVLPHEHELLLSKIGSDGSRIRESNDVYATALELEKAVRDRRLQRIALGFSAAISLVALLAGVSNLGVGLASILVPAVCSLIALLASQATVIVEQRIWPRVPETILAGHEVSGSKDD